MSRNPDRARRSILDAAEQLLHRAGAATVEQVAREAHCAKGLVHYHFRRKGALLAAVVRGVSERRLQQWRKALQAETPHAAIERSWELLLLEQRTGVMRAWIALAADPDRATGHAVSSEIREFSLMLTEATGDLLLRLGREPTVPVQELGSYLAAVVHGIGLELAAGLPAEHMHGAYAAAWLGVLSLTAPAARPGEANTPGRSGPPQGREAIRQ